MLFPDIKAVKSLMDVEKSIFHFRGASIWGRSDEITEEETKLISYRKIQKKNELLLRAGREPELIELPMLQKWNLDGKFTDEFIDFCTEKKTHFIVWQRSDFGVSFFEFDLKEQSCYDKIIHICKEIGAEVKELEKVRDLPHY